MWSGGAPGREAQNRWGVSSIPGAVWLWWCELAAHLSLVHYTCSSGKPVAGSLRLFKLQESPDGHQWSWWPTVRRSHFEGGGWVPGRDCVLEMADSPKHRGGLWHAPVKRSRSVKSQEMPGDMTVINGFWPSSQLSFFSFQLFWLFPKTGRDLIKNPLVLFLFFLLPCLMPFSIVFTWSVFYSHPHTPPPPRIYCAESTVQAWPSCWQRLHSTNK